MISYINSLSAREKSYSFYSIVLFVTLFFITGNAYASSQRYLCKGDTCTVEPDKKAATGNVEELIDFAQTSDIHIVDKGNPLRVEELSVENKDLQKLLDTAFPDDSSATKPIGPYSALLWEYVIKDINKAHAEKSLDFMIATGDFADTSLISEYRLFVELVQGGPITPLKKHCLCKEGEKEIPCACENATKIPEKLEALSPDFYATMGNHDLEYMGSFHTDGFVGGLVKDLALDVDLDELNYIYKLVGLYQGSPKYKNFSEEMDEEDILSGKVKGAYSFDPKPFIHCIVLNTCEYTFTKNNKETPLENLSLGTLSTAQFNWLLNDIDANKDKLCLIFSHHGPHWFWPLISKNDKYFVKGYEVTDALKKKNNVIAWFNGHSHMNKIRAEYNEDGTGYWDVNTCAIIDFPNEWRRVSVYSLDNGLGVIRCEMNRPGGLQENIPMIETKGDIFNMHLGTDNDRGVELYFKLPQEVAWALGAPKPKDDSDDEPDKPVKPLDKEDTDNPTGSADSSSDSESSWCFIASASI